MTFDMKRIHATTKSWTTYVRMLILLSGSVAASLVIPSFVDDRTESFLQSQVVNAGLLYAILVGFLMYITLTRKERIEESVSIELNKTRRMYHLGLHLKEAEPKLASWFDELRSYLDAYHQSFEDRVFEDYGASDGLFRKVTYCIYRLPSSGVAYNDALYASLLDTAASATEAREIINDKINNTIGRFSWMVMSVITFILSAVILFTTPPFLLTQLISALVIFCLLLSLQLLYEYDHSNILKQHYISSLYTQNMIRAKRSE